MVLLLLIIDYLCLLIDIIHQLIDWIHLQTYFGCFQSGLLVLLLLIVNINQLSCNE